MNLDAAIQTFIQESRELLQEMEDSLLRIEQEPDNEDLINAIFRAAHTIKGSAGLFGFDFIVSFTHVVESVLDKVRDGEVRIDGDLAHLFLNACDHINGLVTLAESGQDAPDATVQAAGDALLAGLNQYLGAAPAAAQGSATAQSASHTPDSGGAHAETDNWHISLRFGPDVLRSGMDPASFIRFLTTLGDIVSLTTIDDPVPALADLDPESCYLGFEISLRSSADKNAIEGVFEFVQEDCDVCIIPPKSRMTEYIELIHSLPEEDMRLGDILIRCGTLTHRELAQALAAQAEGEPEHAAPLGELLTEAETVHKPVIAAAVDRQKQIREAKAAESSTIRVDASRLDGLITLVGELVIASAGALHSADRPEMKEAISGIMRLVEEIRDSALNLRMVQIGATFNKFQRVVRDVSRDLGKDIRLEISGAETELDKAVVEKLGDPLMHLVRNSMDHGIESAETRVAAGKPAYGTLKLHAYHESGSIVIEVSDDGGGLNRDKILNKAIEKGLVPAGQEMADRDIYQLIFAAGFSTADQITSLSGRGVGMDVVRQNIEALRGSIDIDSTPGAGTTMRIRLPLTLAIIDGFLVGVGASSFVVPLNMVIECVELSHDLQGADQARHYVNLRGEVLPFIRLRDLFEMGGRATGRENIVIVQYGDQKAGIVVDELLGEFQTVIKPLGKLFQNVRGIGGSTILGTGQVALILDVPGLIHHVIEQENQHFEN